MYAHRDKLQVPVMLGVGAAFDLNTGRLTQAPAWMRENGLEWLFRLWRDPRGVHLGINSILDVGATQTVGGE